MVARRWAREKPHPEIAAAKTDAGTGAVEDGAAFIVAQATS